MSDVFNTDSVLEPLDLSDVRSFLSMSLTDTTEDNLLTMLITQARAIMERWLPFWLAVRQIEMREVVGPDYSVIMKGPLLSVDMVKDVEGTDITSESTLVGEILRLPYGTKGPIQVTFTTGACVPEAIQTALLMVVRNLYIDRASDPMTAEVRSLIADYIEVNI